MNDLLHAPSGCDYGHDYLDYVTEHSNKDHTQDGDSDAQPEFLSGGLCGKLQNAPALSDEVTNTQFGITSLS